MSVSRFLARPLLAAGFVYGGITGLRNASALAPKAAPVTDKVVPMAKKAGLPLPEDTVMLVRINAGAQIVSGLALATGKAPRLAATVLAASMVPTTLAGHPFWTESDPTARKTHLMHFFKNVSMLGGAIIAAGDTDGAPGLAWRTKRAGMDARKGARRAASSVRREAKLAKANLT